MLHFNISISHVDIIKLYVNIIMMHININKLHVNIMKLHADIMVRSVVPGIRTPDFLHATLDQLHHYDGDVYGNNDVNSYYRPPVGGRLFDMKVVSSYVFLRTYYV